jgi:DNA-directed RNA polymerase subunit RPC12/RpoP
MTRIKAAYECEIVDIPQIAQLSDGRWVKDAAIVVPPHVVEEITAGYRCLVCHDVVEEAFPEKCPVCGFPMKERQLEQLEKTNLGEMQVGPTPLDTLDEEREQEGWKKSNGILIPRGFEEGA